MPPSVAAARDEGAQVQQLFVLFMVQSKAKGVELESALSPFILVLSFVTGLGGF